MVFPFDIYKQMEAQVAWRLGLF